MALTREELIQAKERQRWALASIVDWWDGLSNDQRQDLELGGKAPACIQRAKKYCELEPDELPTFP